MPKAQLLGTPVTAEPNPGDRVLGEADKDSFIALLGKGGSSRLMPSKICVPTWGR